MPSITDRLSTRRQTIRTRTAVAMDEYFEKTTSGNTMMYTFSVTFMLFSVYLVSAQPQYYWLFHNILMFFLFPMQFLFFRKDGYHYFFMEFCYSVNYYGMFVTFAALNQWLFPSENPGNIASVLAFFNSTRAMRGFFLLSTGPVVWATKLFGFAIFFHDLREVISCWMHFSPAIVAYTFRWHSEEIHSTFPGMFKFDVNEPLMYWGVWDIALAAVYYIFAWAIPFYFVLWMVKDRLAVKGYKTLIHFVCEGDMLKSFPSDQRPVIYIVGHFIGSVFAMMVSIVWWKFNYAHFAFNCFLLFSMIYAGGYHYYEVYFAKLRMQGTEKQKVRASMYQAAEMISKKVE